MKYEVIPSRTWENKAGKTVSIYGALPYVSEAQKIAEGWEIVERGWTVRNPYTNEVGAMQPPWPTQEAAQAWADANQPSRLSYAD
jgi:hypothetical protein